MWAKFCWVSGGGFIGGLKMVGVTIQDELDRL
jgi:hypothetical protein